MGRIKETDCNTKAHWIAFWVCLSISIFLMIGSALTPPHFIIDSSIFKGVAWLFGFAALSQIPSLVQSGKTARLQHGNTTLTVGGDTDDVDVEPIQSDENLDEEVS